MAQADKLSESYNRAARISALGIGGQQLADIETINKGLEEHNKWLGFIIAARVQLGSLGGLFGKDPGGHGAAITSNTTAAARAEQERVNAIGLATAAANEKWAARQREIADKAAAAAKRAQQEFLAGITSGIAVFDNLASHGTSSSVVNQKLIEDYGKLAAQIREMGTASGPAAAELLKLRDALMANLAVAQAVAVANSTGTVGPLVGKTLPGMSLTGHAADPNKPMAKVGSPSDPIVEVGDQVQIQLQKNADRDAQNALMLQSAIYQSAQLIGSAVQSALNVGGGGKGSQIGSQIGMAAGAIGGSFLGPPGAWFGGAVGSVIGSTVGSVLGSAIGGLFDSHKKEVNANTQAIRANTMALLQNAPNVYKAAQGRFDATNVKEFRRSTTRYATRGGAPVMVVP